MQRFRGGMSVAGGEHNVRGRHTRPLRNALTHLGGEIAPLAEDGVAEANCIGCDDHDLGAAVIQSQRARRERIMHTVEKRMARFIP